MSIHVPVLPGTTIMDYEVQGWGKAVPLPPRLIYIPPEEDAKLLDLPSGWPFSAQPRKTGGGGGGEGGAVGQNGNVPPPGGGGAVEKKGEQEESSEDMRACVECVCVCVCIGTAR